MSKDIVLGNRLIIPAREMTFTFARSQGPGGQNVNKVNSKAILRWNISESPSIPAPMRDRFVSRFSNRINEQGEVVIASDRFREQPRNIADCMAKLRQMLAAVLTAPTRRKKSRPPRAAKEARLRAKLAQAQKKRNRQKPPFE